MSTEASEKEWRWSDAVEVSDSDDAYEPTYRDGSTRSECWSEDAYTGRRLTDPRDEDGDGGR